MREILYQWLLAVPLNLWVGCMAAFLSAIWEVWRHQLALKDGVMIVALAVATAGAVIEFFAISLVWVCLLWGLIVGRGADSLLQSIDATMPDFSDNLVRDVQFYVRKLLANRLGVKMRDAENPTNDEADDVQTTAQAETPQEHDDDTMPKPAPLAQFKQTGKTNQK